MRRTRVLILIDWIWPAYRAGGPVRSIRNLVDQLSHRFEFLILAGDRDLGDEIPFQDVHLGRWIDEDVCRVMYLPRAEQGLFKLYDIINEVRPDVLYVNGIFSRFFSFYPVLLSAVYGLPVQRMVIAPRGMLGQGALRKKKWKKKLYLMLYRRLLRKSGSVLWHAMDEKEGKDVKEVLNTGADSVRIAMNIPERPLEDINTIPKGTPLKLISVSRLAREKNIDGMLDWLQGFDGKVRLDMYGHFEDESYEESVIDLSKRLKSGVEVNFCGLIRPSQVMEAMQEHHFFISLSHGENFGHAIYESLACGRPVIISPYTPWNDVERTKGGVVINSKAELQETLQQLNDISQNEWESMCEAALLYAKRSFNMKRFEADYIKLFSQ